MKYRKIEKLQYTSPLTFDSNPATFFYIIANNTGLNLKRIAIND
jgi:hypothetical protein